MKAVLAIKLFNPVYKTKWWYKGGTRTENSKPASVQAELGYGSEMVVLYVMCQSTNINETEGI